MKIFQVEYPFEVNMELGRSHCFYPSLKVAMRDAAEHFAANADEAERIYAEHGTELTSWTEPAKVTQETVAKLTKDSVCKILNEAGDFWADADADSKLIGEIVFNANTGKVKLKRAKS